MDNQIEPLTTENRKYLHTVCVELKLETFFEPLEERTQLLRMFELYEKPVIKSKRGKIKALENVAAAAKVLATAIHELDVFQKIGIAKNLPPDGLSTSCELTIRHPGLVATIHLPAPDCHVSYPLNRYSHGRVGHIGIEAERLSKYCSEICRDENTLGANGGRKNTLDFYAFFVSRIWNDIKGSNINLGRGGTFEKLCEAVFSAAGVKTSPEGAIRKYIKGIKADENTPDDDPF